jgi:phospholipid/cholesterol/gamma-HCH transport system ATP-binding protein
VPPQIVATPGMPERQAVARRQARVREIMHTLAPGAQEAIRDDLEDTHRYHAHLVPDAATASIPDSSNSASLRATGAVGVARQPDDTGSTKDLKAG